MGRKPLSSQRPIVSVVTSPSPVERISTGSILLDSALKGGIPRGVTVVISGRADTGKTLLCSHIVANAVKKGLNALILDLEGRFIDLERLLNRGLTPEQIEKHVKIMSSVFTVEDAAKIIRGELTTSEPPAVIVVDSLAAIQSLSSFKSISEEEGKGGLGETARAFTREFRDILYGLIQKTQSILLLTTQKRTTIQPYGAYESDYLPNILRHAPAIYLQLRADEDEGSKDSPFRAEKVRDLTRTLFKKITFSFEKNQTGFPHAKGVLRYFLFTREDYGIRIGDWDLVFEICGFGSAAFFRVVRTQNEGNTKYYVSPSGQRYALTELYTNPKVREKFLEETADIFLQKMLQFWSGEFVSLDSHSISSEMDEKE